MEEAKHFIGGEWQSPASGETLAAIDPSTGQPFAQLARGNAADIDSAVTAARKAFEGAWGALSAAERGRMLFALSGLVGQH
ncbi:aldehyde dehydrogenase family protein, partial [Paraburkholderia sp. BR14261]